MQPRLFLDIDGVLNHGVRYTVFDYPRLFLTQCKYAQVIVEATDCEIVLVTNWRYIIGVEAVGELLWAAGITAPVLGGTAVCSSRGEGVRQYQADSTAPYVILDDLPEYYPDQPLILTDNDIGLTPQGAMQAINLLKGIP